MIRPTFSKRFAFCSKAKDTIEAVTSPAAILDALKTRDYDVVLMDLNYTRDTTSGRKASTC